MAHTVSLIYGDGIGPEVVSATTKIIEHAGVNISWDEVELGLSALKKFDSTVPKHTLDSIKKNKVALKGPTTTPVGKGHVSANVTLRKELDLYACIRPIKSIPGVKTRFENVDIVVFRENTEGLYSGKEIEINQDLIVSLRTMSRKGCMRIAKAAFEYAKNNNRKTVCAAHKANILKKGDGLFLECAQEVKKEYPHIEYQEAIIDALCMRTVMEPSQFDILLLENMFGDIVSDLCAGLVGGLGIVPGANMGDQACVFEAVHGSAPDIANKGLANPTAMIKSAIMMLDHVKENEAARNIEQALTKALSNKSLITKDLGGNASTNDFVKGIIKNLA